MKKLAAGTAVLAAAAVLTAIPVFAENTTSAKTDLTLYVPNDPVYTITVPETVELYTITVPETVELSATENTQVPVTASDVKYIPEGKKISVTFEKGNGTFGRLYLTGVNEETGKDYTLTLYIKGTEGEFKMGALENQIKGMELAAFTDNGTMNYELRPANLEFPDSTSDNLKVQKGVHYSASVTYGIELTDIE